MRRVIKSLCLVFIGMLLGFPLGAMVCTIPTESRVFLSMQAVSRTYKRYFDMNKKTPTDLWELKRHSLEYGYLEPDADWGKDPWGGPLIIETNQFPLIQIRSFGPPFRKNFSCRFEYSFSVEK